MAMSVVCLASYRRCQIEKEKGIEKNTKPGFRPANFIVSDGVGRRAKPPKVDGKGPFRRVSDIS